MDWLDLERELCRLPEVTAARIVNDGDRPVEIHIIAEPVKPAKQVVRDVQSVALASFGLEVDRRIVSVVQLGGEQLDGASEASPRPRIVAISAEQTQLRSLVRVTLALQDTETTGFAEGSIAAAARHRLVAAATLDALRQLEPAAAALDVEAAQIQRVGAYDVAIVTVVYVAPPDEHVVSGSAIVRQRDDADAIARALLDATNRRLPRA